VRRPGLSDEGSRWFDVARETEFPAVRSQTEFGNEVEVDEVEKPRMTVSLCMIVKNEAANLAKCLESVADLVDEMIVVDTGSADDTKAAAKRLGAKVYDFTWTHSFAAARNESLAHASGKWILWLDGDEYFDAENRGKLRRLLCQLGDENAAYVMRQLSVHEGRNNTGTVADQVRLFRHHSQIRWEYRIHEQILPALGRFGADIRFTDIVLQHTGYEDPALVAEKLQRNLKLIDLENAEHPNDPFTLFNLGWAYLALGRTAEAVRELQKSLELAPAGASIVHKLYALLIAGHRKLQQPELALAACRAGLARCPDDAELMFLEGTLLQERGELAGAERCFVQLVSHDQRPGTKLHCSLFSAPTFGSVDLGIRGYQARHHLALVYLAQGRDAEAEKQWQAAVAEQPGFGLGWLHLGELWLRQERWAQVEQSAQRLLGYPPLALQGMMLLAKAHLARREFPFARKVLEQVIAKIPQLVVPRVLLTHVLLQEDQDGPEVEPALRSVVEMDPSQTETWRNLVVLLRHRQRYDEALGTCRQARNHHPQDTDLLLMQGLLHEDVRDCEEAEKGFLAVLERPGGDAKGQQMRILARHHLAHTYRQHGRSREAEVQWRAVTAAMPDFAPAWVELGRLWLSQQRWADVEEAAVHLANGARAEGAAAMLRRRAAMVREEVEATKGG